MHLEPNVLFDDRYRLIDLKGRGTFGEVWLARDEQLEMQVAIKVYIALDDRGVSDFISEYRTTYGLNHPNLLHAYHFAMCEKRPYLVMPFCPGSAVDLVGNADEQTLWQFIRDVASGLAYLHSKDIVHHDIKPDNVLIDEQGHFVITDFGISTKMRSTLRRNSAREMNANSPLGGSLSYMGPEMFSAQAESVKATDIWALGATLYEIAVGELPFFGQGGVMLINGADISRPNVSYSDALVNTIMACLAKETWDRPLASQLVEMAKSALSGGPINEGARVKTPMPDVNPPHEWKSQDPIYERERSPLNNETGMGTIIEGGESPLGEVKKKKNLVWLWILIPILVLVPVLWLVLGGNGSKADDEMFAQCKTANEYRAYLKKYPDGKNASNAQIQLNRLINDSIANLQPLAFADPVEVVEDEPVVKAEEKHKETKPEEKPIETKMPDKKVAEEQPVGNNAIAQSGINKPVVETGKFEEPEPDDDIDASPDDDLFDKPIHVTNKKDGKGNTYTGSMLPTGKYEGYGRLEMASGEIYEGNWKNGKRHGEGKNTYTNGDWYEGNWQNGTQQGRGEFHYYRSGNVYKGNFSGGKFNGYGEMTYGSGDFSSYRGSWSNGVINGSGVMFYRNGAKYDGDWKNNKRHGQGTYTWENGEKYVGSFVDGNMTGTGTVYYSNGSVKESGQFYNGKKQN